MAGHVYHYKHGWIRLDHEAAGSAKGINTRQDVAKAIMGMPKVPAHERTLPKHDIVRAARKTGSNDLLPKTWTPEGHNGPIPADMVRDLRGGSADKHLVTDAAGETHFSPERTALHDKIIAQILGKPKAQKHPAFVFLGGGPASGKSKAADAADAEFPDAVKLDPDAIKALLPEYGQMKDRNKAAAFAHEESSYLAKRATEEALASRAHVVLDAVGNNSAANMRKKIQKARDAGYTTHGRYVTVATETAQQRAVSRGARTGRVVNPDVIADLHAGVSRVFPEILREFDSAALYDNTTEWKQVLSKFRGQPEVIHELQAWRAFLRKG